ncbi:helix-turn-helix transcriptional regulator [Bacillus sp. 37MA]|uniref:helix-turn-helix domain-containing protein n=1 Tax=Bacillus sp. 37MA TaxID=1132442 RepID=UPI000379E9CE|nr:helix-turn-helix transcriptional regulator [Bacillus sp. 37MA]
MAKRLDIKLKQVLQERGINQKTLALQTGLTERGVSELASGKLQRLPKKAIESIADALEIDDINELLTLVDVEEENKEDAPQ